VLLLSCEVDRYNPRVTDGPEFRKSSFCSGGNCVEVGADRPDVLVRDSKDPDAPAMRFTAAEWRAFVAGVKAGEFDFLS
jgi:hypothetical protein